MKKSKIIKSIQGIQLNLISRHLGTCSIIELKSFGAGSVAKLISIFLWAHVFNIEYYR